LDQPPFCTMVSECREVGRLRSLWKSRSHDSASVLANLVDLEISLRAFLFLLLSSFIKHDRQLNAHLPSPRRRDEVVSYQARRDRRQCRRNLVCLHSHKVFLLQLTISARASQTRPSRHMAFCKPIDWPTTFLPPT
jgi:hypothetical protein